MVMEGKIIISGASIINNTCLDIHQLPSTRKRPYPLNAAGAKKSLFELEDPPLIVIGDSSGDECNIGKNANFLLSNECHDKSEENEMIKPPTLVSIASRIKVPSMLKSIADHQTKLTLMENLHLKNEIEECRKNYNHLEDLFNKMSAHSKECTTMVNDMTDKLRISREAESLALQQEKASKDKISSLQTSLSSCDNERRTLSIELETIKEEVRLLRDELATTKLAKTSGEESLEVIRRQLVTARTQEDKGKEKIRVLQEELLSTRSKGKKREEDLLSSLRDRDEKLKIEQKNKQEIEKDLRILNDGAIRKEKKYDSMKRDINDCQNELKKTLDQKSSLVKSLNLLRSRFEVSKRQLDMVNEQMKDLQEELASTKSQLKTAEEKSRLVLLECRKKIDDEFHSHQRTKEAALKERSSHEEALEMLKEQLAVLDHEYHSVVESLSRKNREVESKIKFLNEESAASPPIKSRLTYRTSHYESSQQQPHLDPNELNMWKESNYLYQKELEKEKKAHEETLRKLCHARQEIGKIGQRLHQARLELKQYKPMQD